MSTAPRMITRPVASDAVLFERIAAGDLGALGAIYDRHQASLRHFVTRATAGGADVDDLVHITFLEAAKSAARYDGRDSARTWLLGIAVNHVKRSRSAWARLVKVLGQVGRAEAIDPRPRHEARTDLDRALARLSAAKRTTFLLAELEELSCAEIAELMKVPIGTVWTRLHAARRELRASLEEAP